MLDRLFWAHPRSVGESYFQHLHCALSFAGLLMAAAFACFVHALIPACFEHTASRAVNNLHDRMVLHRTRTAQRETGIRSAAYRKHA